MDITAETIIPADDPEMAPLIEAARVFWEVALKYATPHTLTEGAAPAQAINYAITALLNASQIEDDWATQGLASAVGVFCSEYEDPFKVFAAFGDDTAMFLREALERRALADAAPAGTS